MSEWIHTLSVGECFVLAIIVMTVIFGIWGLIETLIQNVGITPMAIKTEPPTYRIRDVLIREWSSGYQVDCPYCKNSQPQLIMAVTTTLSGLAGCVDEFEECITCGKQMRMHK